MILCAALLVLGVALIPFDGALSRAAIEFRQNSLGGDLRRELEALQQYGQGAITLLVVWAIWLLDRGRRARLLDWGAAALVAMLAANGLKMLIGRPRPKFDDPAVFLGPFGAYPIDETVGVRHAWEIGSGISSDLWSMPSSHTVFAVVMSVALATLYPGLRPLAVVMAVLVALGRVLFGAHYPSDVLIGGAVGLAVAWPAMAGGWGRRVLRVGPGRGG
jgi:membrane-associated phospholipid phosphatase